MYSRGCRPSLIQPSPPPGGHRAICRDSRSPQGRGRLRSSRGQNALCWSSPRSHGAYSPLLSAPPRLLHPLAPRLGLVAGMSKGQTPGETACFPLTPGGTHAHSEPGQMRASLLLAFFYPQADKDGQEKHPHSPRLLFPTCHVS